MRQRRIYRQGRARTLLACTVSGTGPEPSHLDQSPDATLRRSCCYGGGHARAGRAKRPTERSSTQSRLERTRSAFLSPGVGGYFNPIETGASHERFSRASYLCVARPCCPALFCSSCSRLSFLLSSPSRARKVEPESAGVPLLQNLGPCNSRSGLPSLPFPPTL